MKSINHTTCITAGLAAAGLLAAAFACISCADQSDSYKDTLAPDKVSSLSAVSGNAAVTLTWTDPHDTDFDHVVVAYGSHEITVPAGTEMCKVTDLTNEQNYQFKVYAYDMAGNKSVNYIGGTPTVYTGGYILAYFKSNNDGNASYENLHLAYSSDGLNYTQLNSGSPVYTIASSVGSGGQCVRDCYVTRIQDSDTTDTVSNFIYLATDWTNYGSGSYSNTAYGTTGTTSYWGTVSPCLIIADIAVDTSTNKVTFSNARCKRMVTLSDDAFAKRNKTQMHAWAPEVIQDPLGGTIYTASDGTAYKYGVIWSGDGDLAGNNYVNRTYVNYTNDFTTFTDPILFFEAPDLTDMDSDGDYAEAVTEIDATVTKVDDMYYMFYKGEASAAKDIQVASSSSLAPGSFTVMHNGKYVTRTTDQGTAAGIEGPFVLNAGGTWWLFGDHYGSSSVTSTANFYGYSCGNIAGEPVTWGQHANDGKYSFPAGVRHAIAFRVTSAELTALTSASW